MLKSYEQELYLSDVELDVEKGTTDSITIKIIQEARGNSFKDAISRAENIEYSYSISGNEINFDPYLIVQKADLYRVQKVRIKVLIPEGKTVYLDESSGWIIYDIDNVTNIRDKYMLGKFWTMTPNGLDCLHTNMSKEAIRERRKQSRERRSNKPVVPKHSIPPPTPEAQPQVDTAVTASNTVEVKTKDALPVFPSPFAGVMG